MKMPFAVRSACMLVALCIVATLAIGISSLTLSLRLYRPDVVLSSSAVNPDGYIYGGAVYQGSGAWVTNKARLPSARAEHVAVPIGDTIYLFGGLNASNIVIDETLGFNSLREVYNTLARMPIPRYRFAASAVDTMIYVVGGCSSLHGDPLAEVDVYDTERDKWLASGSVPPSSLPRYNHAMAAVNDKLYVVGGMAKNNDMSVAGALLEEYDTVTKIWRVLPPMPTSRTDLMALAYNGQVWAMGGWLETDSSRGPGGDFQACVEAYNPDTGRWTSYAQMLTRKADSAVATYRKQIVTVGGESWSGRFEVCGANGTQLCKVNQVPTHDTVTFIPTLDPPLRADSTGPGGLVSETGTNAGAGVWISLAPMPGARFRFAAAATESSQGLFVFGGISSGAVLLDSVSAFYDTYHPHVFMHYKDGAGWW